MDRYQFEGYISEYIENKLSISKRKEFEEYLTNNPVAKEKVEAVRTTIRDLKALPKVKTSADFMEKLQSRVASQSDVIPVQQETRRSLIFGFTPLTATMMSLVMVAIVFVGYELLPSGSSSPVAVPQQQMSTNSMIPVPAPVNTTPSSQMNAPSVVAAVEEDSSAFEEDLPQISPALEDKINYVKTQ